MPTSPPTDRRVAVLGYGIEGSAAVRALRRWGYHRLAVLTDAPPTSAVDDGIDHVWGDAALDAISGSDLIVRSPGIRPDHRWLENARALGIPVTTPTNLFMERARALDLPVIGITGSKGKSTTASLAHAVLVEAGIPCRLVGNIGTAALDLLDDIAAERAVTVFEMSSYQTFDLAVGPSIAVLLRLFPEHLDWHGGVEPYFAAKCRIAARQRPQDVTIYNAGDPAIVARLPLGPARHAAFNDASGFQFADGWFRLGATPLFADGAMILRGLHNRLNACAALAAASRLGARPDHLERVLAVFRGLPHRLEDVGVHDGIRWINDSIATAPEAAVAAIEAFPEGVATFIGGGTDRGFDFAPLARALLDAGVPRVILVPPGGEKIGEALSRLDSGAAARVALARDLEEAVAIARRTTPAGGLCLFSPASPSYGVFRNFEERGETFRRLVTWRPDQ